MNNLTSLHFKVSDLSTQLQDTLPKLLHIVIGILDCLFVGDFTVLQQHQIRHHVVIVLQSGWISQLSIVLDGLVPHCTILSLPCLLKIPKSRILYVLVYLVKLGDLPLCFLIDLAEVIVLLLEELSQRLNTVLIHILAELIGLARLRQAILLEVDDMVCEGSHLERLGILVRAYPLQTEGKCDLSIYSFLEHGDDVLGLSDSLCIEFRLLYIVRIQVAY